MTERRIRQLKAEGIKPEKLEEKSAEILKNLSDNGFTLHESEILISILNCKLIEMKQRSPATKISEIIQYNGR